MSSLVLQVDDSDTTRIKYTEGDWSMGGSNFDHNLTTHSLNGVGSFSFTFNGSSVSVYGTVAAHTVSNSVNCTIDNVTTNLGPTTSASDTAVHNFKFCTFSSLPDYQEHILIAETSSDEGASFLLDYILYEISTDPPGETIPAGSLANVIIDDDDTDRIIYTGSWKLGGKYFEYDSTTHGAMTSGSSASFAFQGTGAQVYGTYSLGDGCDNIVNYTVDNSAPVGFCVSPNPQQLITQALMYDTGLLDNGNHTLLMTSTNWPGGLYFYIDFIIYTTYFGGDPMQLPDPLSKQSSSYLLPSADPTSSLPVNQSPTIPASSARATHHRLATAVIVVIVLVVVCICLFAGVLAIYLKGRRRKTNSISCQSRAGSIVEMLERELSHSSATTLPIFRETASQLASDSRLGWSRVDGSLVDEESEDAPPAYSSTRQ